MDRNKFRVLALIVILVLMVGSVLYISGRKVMAGEPVPNKEPQKGSLIMEKLSDIKDELNGKYFSKAEEKEDTSPDVQSEGQYEKVLPEQEVSGEEVPLEKPERPADFDPFDFASVIFLGYDGEGIARCGIFEDPYGEMEFADAYVEPAEGLTNGDEVVLHILYYPDYMAKLVSKAYIVEGLSEKDGEH